MNIWAVMELRAANALGLPSRAGEMLSGRTALSRTVERVRRTRGLAGVAVLVEPGRAEAARGSLAGSEARVLEVLGPDSHSRESLRRARKWSTDSWRGGIRQTMDLDSCNDYPSLAAAARELRADALLSVLPEAVLVEPAILEGLIGHLAPQDRPVMPAAMCQAPGGFAGLLGMSAWIESMASGSKTFGSLMAWEPGKASHDPVHQRENFLAPVAVRRCEFRGALESMRSCEMLAEILRRAPGADGLGPTAEEAVALVRADAALYAGRLPRIVEVELTTAGRVAFADTPSAAGAPEQFLPRALFEKLLAEISGSDDVLVTLGGRGDPLVHPEVFDFLRLARRAGVYGLHLDTPGVHLDESTARRLLECDVDVVSLRLGAATAETYRRLTGRDDFDSVCANVGRLMALRGETGAEWPFVVVEAEKRVEAEPELLDFVDRWSAHADGAILRPASDYCGQLPDRASVHLTLAERVGCRRLLKEMMVLADGTVPVCRMDFAGKEPAGHLGKQSVGELWAGGIIAKLRAEHAARKFDGFRLCPACRDWDSI